MLVVLVLLMSNRVRLGAPWLIAANVMWHSTLVFASGPPATPGIGRRVATLSADARVELAPVGNEFAPSDLSGSHRATQRAASQPSARHASTKLSEVSEPSLDQHWLHASDMLNAKAADPANHSELGQEMTSIVGAWVAFHVVGHQLQTLKSNLPRIVHGIRAGVADGIGVCRPLVRITRIKGLEHNLHELEEMDLHQVAEGQVLARSTMRSAAADKAGSSLKLNMDATQIRAEYEVRVLHEMGMNDTDVKRRVDLLQMYPHFGELSRDLARSLSEFGTNLSYYDISLYDVGRANPRSILQPAFLQTDMDDCIEEQRLHDARMFHEVVILIAIIMVLLITCGASTVFMLRVLPPSRAFQPSGFGDGQQRLAQPISLL